MQDTKRKQLIQDNADKYAQSRGNWIKKNKYFYQDDYSYMRFLVNKNKSILDLGCGTGELLKELEPSFGVGVDFSKEMISVAENKYPEFNFIQGDLEDPKVLSSIEGPFDYIILSDTIGYLDDCEVAFSNLHSLCNSNTRLIISYYSWHWEPILRFGQKVGLAMPSPGLNWFTSKDAIGFLNLADFEMVKQEWRQLIPKKLFGFGALINRFFGTLPLLSRLALRNYIVARPLAQNTFNSLSTTVLIPCRNEKGNIENAIKRIPNFCNDIEVIFVEGGSQDGTLDEINRVIELYPNKDIKVFQQEGMGKGDAVRKGFSNARGEVLMILDADLTVPPEDLPKFYNAIASGRGEFINGTRLIYPMEDEAMRYLNYIGNRIFALLFTWLLNQRITDTLCGTKVLTRESYEEISKNRSYFGDFDPFGDFDIIFGAMKNNLKCVEVPIRYKAREYGDTQIDRFRHGILLFRMVWFAYKKLKIV
ncbi:glycosyltransferase [Candidatus Thioglobus sp.]|nr:glycosyltransferase [Candidatus Thioglobus sp.]